MVYDPAKYAVGTRVRVKPRVELEAFLRPQYQYHHPLQDNQLQYAGHTATVAKSYMYHGGGVLYELSGMPGIWHEVCVETNDSGHAV
jgi:hypothetical protein